MTSARPSAKVSRALAKAADRAATAGRRTITPDDLLLSLLSLPAASLEALERMRGPLTVIAVVTMLVEGIGMPTTFSGGGNGLARFDVLYEVRKAKGRGKRRTKR